jgi:hypothetical protein
MARTKQDLSWWKGAPEFSKEGKAITAAFPDFSLRIWCNVRGVQVVAHVDRTDAKGRLHRTVVARHEFHPPEVTERLVVEWGRRVCAAWLEQNAKDEAE